MEATEISLLAAIESTEARALFVDDELDKLAESAKNEVLAEVGQNYQASLYRRLFEGQSPSAFRKPVLSTQLTSMRTWIAPLSAQTNQKLKDIATELTKVVKAADDVIAAQGLAQQKYDDFCLGPRTELIEKINGTRKLTYGKLSEMVHAPGGDKLPSGFAERFFLYGSGSKAPTIERIQQEINRLKGKLARKETQLAELKEKEARQIKMRQEAELAERRLKLEAAQKKAAEAAAEVARLEEEMKKLPES